MRQSFVLASLFAGSVAIVGMSPPKATSSARSMEVARLRSHFDSVDVELRSRDVSTLTSSQLANRGKLISWLRDYRNAGSFPTNDRFSVATPFFRDKDGVLCAMAYLIHRSGSSDIVDKVADTRNNAYIRELADDPALIAWLHKWGLSVSEAARIQPSYGGGGMYPDDPYDDDEVDSDFALAALGLSSISLATSAVNVVKPGKVSGFLGLIAGTVSVIAGASYLDEGSGSDKVAGATIGVGALSIGAGIYGLLEARRDHDDRDRYRDGRRRRISLAVAPDVAVTRESPRVGMLLRAKF